MYLGYCSLPPWGAATHTSHLSHMLTNMKIPRLLSGKIKTIFWIFFFYIVVCSFTKENQIWKLSCREEKGDFIVVQNDLKLAPVKCFQLSTKFLVYFIGNYTMHFLYSVWLEQPSRDRNNRSASIKWSYSTKTNDALDVNERHCLLESLFSCLLFFTWSWTELRS